MESQKSSLFRKSKGIKKLKRFWIVGRDGDWAFGRTEFMIKSLQNCSLTNTGSEMLLSAHFISVNSAELELDVMQKKAYGSYCSGFPWGSLGLLATLGFCCWNVNVVPIAMWNALMTLKERKGARGRNNAQAGVKVGLDCQAACQRQCRTVPQRASGSSLEWGVFSRCFPLSHGGGASSQLALQVNPASVISRSITHVFRVFLFIKDEMPQLKQFRESCCSSWCT